MPRTFLLLLCLFWVSNTAFAQKTYTHKKEDVSISFPEDWLIEEQPKGSELIVMVTAPARASNDGYHDNFNLVVYDLPEKLDMATYEIAVRGQMKSVLEDFKVLDSKVVTVSGQKALRMVYTNINSEQTLKQTSITFIKKGKKALVFTFSTLQETAEDYEELFNQMIGSITFD